MFVSKRSKKRFWNNSFSNRLWLATVIMMTAGTGITVAAAVESPSTLVPEQTTAATARPNVTVDCVRRGTCAECAAAAPACSWSLVHQSCNDTAATERQLIEDPGDDGHHHPPTKPVVDAGSCPRFKVDYQKQTTMDATNRTLNVKVSNDPTGKFRALLERGQVLCHLNEMKFPGKVESGGRQITCQADHLESANSSLSSIVYFYTSVNGAALTFDDKRDHYLDFTVPRNACVTENPMGPSDECKVCLWDDDRAYRYYCQWCPKSNPCTGSYQQCDVRRLADPGRTVTVQDVFVQCPEVRIESIEPLYGSWAGGTTIRIAISNHRTLSENKVIVVKVADSRCLLPTASVDGTMITCTIPPTNSSALNQGPVEVTYRSEVNKLLPTFTLKSNQSFYFVEPVITNVWPSCGPVTGGTRVTIRGRFLDAGNTVRVYMRDNITCAVQTHSQNEVTCLTGASDGPSASAIRIEFDHYLNKYVYDPPFMYTSAPALDGGQSFRGISSGGTQLPVRGHDFACIRNPLVHVSYNGIQYTGSCAVRNDTYMVCTAPTINRPAPHQVTALLFGFQADYNNTIVKMPLPAGTPDYTLYPDPVYTNFETEGRTVTVYGLNIDQGYDQDADLSVLFHKTGVPCNVTSVQPDRIVCRPPKRLSFNDHGGRSDDGRVDGYGSGDDNDNNNNNNDDDDDDDLPAALVNDEIIVTVGNLVYEVKRKPQTRPRTFPIRINTIIFGGIALVSLIITIVAAIVYCMKIAMTISQQQTEMRSLCEHLNSTETGLGVCTGTETGSKGDVESAAAAAPAKDRS